MKNIINKVIGKIGKITGKSRKFFPVVDEHRKFKIVDKPKKFFFLTEREYLLEMRRQGIHGNGICNEQDF